MHFMLRHVDSLPPLVSLIVSTLSSVSQWRPFLPGLKYEVIDSAHISLYTGKTHPHTKSQKHLEIYLFFREKSFFSMKIAIN